MSETKLGMTGYYRMYQFDYFEWLLKQESTLRLDKALNSLPTNLLWLWACFFPLIELLTSVVLEDNVKAFMSNGHDGVACLAFSP